VNKNQEKQFDEWFEGVDTYGMDLDREGLNYRSAKIGFKAALALSKPLEAACKDISILCISRGAVEVAVKALKEFKGEK